MPYSRHSSSDTPETVVPKRYAPLRNLAAASLVLLFFGCTSVNVDMSPYYAPVPVDCPVTVTDQRADPGLITGSDTNYNISPPVSEVLRSRLCRNTVIRTYVARNTLNVVITDLRVAKYGFVGSDEMLTTVGYAEVGPVRHHIQSYRTVGFAGLPATRWQALLNSSLDEFVRRVEEAIPGQN